MRGVWPRVSGLSKIEEARVIAEWRELSLRASAKSPSLEITSAQSKKSCEASKSKCTARFTSEPFSSALSPARNIWVVKDLPAAPLSYDPQRGSKRLPV